MRVMSELGRLFRSTFLAIIFFSRKDDFTPTDAGPEQYVPSDIRCCWSWMPYLREAQWMIRQSRGPTRHARQTEGGRSARWACKIDDLSRRPDCARGGELQGEAELQPPEFTCAARRVV
ncbi:hypothetical protein L1887_48850 [Cichorium endivia]|nr:hypothetical protein L1887_48850 [Cichorium endivia]